MDKSTAQNMYRSILRAIQDRSKRGEDGLFTGTHKKMCETFETMRKNLPPSLDDPDAQRLRGIMLGIELASHMLC